MQTNTPPLKSQRATVPANNRASAAADVDFQLSNHQLRTAIMNTVSNMRPSHGTGALPPETIKLLNEHLAELQQIERLRAATLIAPQ